MAPQWKNVRTTENHPMSITPYDNGHMVNQLISQHIAADRGSSLTCFLCIVARAMFSAQIDCIPFDVVPAGLMPTKK